MLYYTIRAIELHNNLIISCILAIFRAFGSDSSLFYGILIQNYLWGVTPIVISGNKQAPG